MKNNLIEVVQVPILRRAHLRVGEVLRQILDEGQCLVGPLNEQLSVHDSDKARQHHRRC